ncbi:sigma 54-interacting transcriptional regulator [Rodentibacter caecimuris]|uniref:HTH-type transcriptional regulatory protein TyrR n=1 Tax=Rodentibacter caecimuris TaxID=1796644 RepID=A0ABX3KZN7_9PAST|nr:transcriptional regulator [Rodentibacter heylii]
MREPCISQSFSRFTTNSPKMKSAVENGIKFSQSDASLLIQGETGTGKDLFAKACHQASQRSQQKFIAVNCAGLPDYDAESEMFGRHSTEQESIGFFEYANGGTVLLDNIGELSLPLQAKLLRFLNDGTFRRVGEEKENYSDVRVICTSQIPLSYYVREGKMRQDLFHRLNVLSITIPPLRERREDFEQLVDDMLNLISKHLGRKKPLVNELFLQFLKGYSWPGNVRELYNQLYQACSLTESNQLSTAHLSLTEQTLPAFSLSQFEDKSLEEIMNQFEAQILRQFYEEYPSTRKLAQRLGVSHTAIANKLKQYGIGK